ncbi:hypothetical protein Cantr_06860 [Candida viswanathii]|uniref:Uncharacterized protein n=1 Tax=Candida viswanathii TaxID=5486 RepID=A0A367XX35_9ASCO|nr:hypothetical protein Cantr_06860 [Candida viswanathii]
MNPPSFKLCDYAVIVSLREELYDLVTNEVSSRTAEEHSVLQESIYSLIHCIYGCEFFEFPLKILYRYSSLNAISGFYYHESRNVWKDYMIWYAKRYEMAEIDRQLYYLAVQKNYKWEDHTKFQEFDPAVEYDKLRRLDGAQ